MLTLKGSYICNSGLDNALNTVSKPMNDYTTDDGYLNFNNAVSGQKACDAGSENHFDFSIKYNKSGTNCRDIWYPRPQNGSRWITHVYQVKSNSITSLSIDSKATTTHPYPTTRFYEKGTIEDVTNAIYPLPVACNG